MIACAFEGNIEPPRARMATGIDMASAQEGMASGAEYGLGPVRHFEIHPLRSGVRTAQAAAALAANATFIIVAGHVGPQSGIAFAAIPLVGAVVIGNIFQLHSAQVVMYAGAVRDLIAAPAVAAVIIEAFIGAGIVAGLAFAGMRSIAIGSHIESSGVGTLTRRTISADVTNALVVV